MNMKKLTTLLLSAGLLFSMAACSSSKIDDDALTLLETGMNHFEKMESASYNASMDVKIPDSNASIAFKGGYLEKDNKLNFSLLMDVKEDGEKAEELINVYYKDDTAYINLMDLNKMKIDVSDLLDQAKQSEPAETKSEGFKKEDIKPFLDKASLDGNKVKLVLNKEKLDAAMADEIKKQSEAAGYDMTMNIKSATAEVTVKDDFIEDAVIDFVMTVSADVDGKKESIDMNIKLNISFSDINQNKEINFPDFKGYEETDIMSLIYGMSSAAGGLEG
ncbi:hypothetical protein DXA09_14345 [Absiella sp. AM54-8XD]|jgi:hypothetical protein|nr:hypothetical protein DW271_18730 [Absiella sp. AM22-9]RGB53907.1 hypothetical protein DW120_19225 [Absiella sp. AM10-20]RGC19781.1 hypothetical protein DXA09_14345 [Absiella sp. AM54-8XD]RHU07200.1 hypothetical protein DW716_09385 [Absiella sp. AM27-20]